MKKRQVGIINFSDDDRCLIKDNFSNYLKQIFDKAKINLELNSNVYTQFGVPLIGIKKLYEELLSFISELKSKSFTFEKNHKIDRIIIYFFYSKILSDYDLDEMVEILVFLSLVREFLNLVGPLFFKKLQDKNIENINYPMDKEYTEFSYGFDIPHLIVDFQEYLNESFLEKNQMQIKLNLLEFTNFLYDEEVVFYKVEEKKKNRGKK